MATNEEWARYQKFVKEYSALCTQQSKDMHERMVKQMLKDKAIKESQMVQGDDAKMYHVPIAVAERMKLLEKNNIHLRKTVVELHNIARCQPPEEFPKPHPKDCDEAVPPKDDGIDPHGPGGAYWNL